LLSNIVLDELDWELDRRGHHFVRYADDCNIYVRSERAGKRVMASVTQFIEKRLRLQVNQEKSAVARPEERHFLGFSLRRNPRDGDVDVLLSKRSKDRLARQVLELTPRNWGSSLKACIHRVNRYLGGWIGFFFVCSGAELSTLRHTDGHLRRRLRAILLKQQKKRCHMIRLLNRLGARRATVRRAVYGGTRSLWRLSATPSVHQALNNQFFKEQGLITLEQRWRKLQLKVNAPEQVLLCLE
jgi:hypothetical protein